MFASLSSNRTDSVISSSSRLAGKPEAAEGAGDHVTNPGRLNWNGEILTATLMVRPGAAWAQACLMAHSPSGTISPVSSPQG